MRRALLGAAALAAAATIGTITAQLAAADSSDETVTTATTAQPATTGKRTRRTRTLAVRRIPDDGAIIHRIQRARGSTWHWQAVMGRRRTPSAGSEARRNVGTAYRLWVLRLWQRRAATTWQAARRPPHRAQWQCIHRYEGSWTDPGAPYYGGLQMDLGFQQTYGAYLLRRKGTADHWTPLEQMWVAEQAHRSRGFSPWPNTARYCGLM